MRTTYPPQACENCGKELPAAVIAAGSFLMDGYQSSRDRLMESIADDLKRKPNDDARRSELGLKPRDDRQLGEDAITLWICDDFDADDLVAAVRHYGDLGGEDGSECETIVWERDCHEPTPDYTADDKRASTCVLEAHGADVPHQFTYEPVAAAQASS